MIPRILIHLNLKISRLKFKYKLLTQMRPKSMLQKPSSQRVFRYSIEASIQQIQLNIRFPCKLSVHWNYGQGSVTSIKPIPLEKGIARFEEILCFSAHITFNQQKQQYIEQKTTIEIFIITENGNSLAGFVTLDLAKLVVNGGEKKQVFAIERCPDRSANLKMKLSCQFITEKYSRVTNFESSVSYRNKDREKDRDSSLFDGRAEQYSKRIDPQSVKNKELIQKQLVSLKNKVAEYESKYKSQKSEKQKLNDLLKGKEEVYFTLKTQIKRKQIQIDGMLKSLDQYRFQYQRLKTDNDLLIKTKEKLQSAIDNIERSSHEKLSRLESQNISLIRKFEKLENEFGRTSKEKDTLFISIREKNEGSTKEKEMFNESTRQLRKQKQDILRNYKIDKQNYEKLLRQSHRRIEQLEEQLNDTKQKCLLSNKKVTKVQEQRIEEITKNNLKIIQLQKSKESLTIELTTLKRELHKKDHHYTESNKNLQKQLNDQRINNGKLTQSVIDLQNEKKLQAIDLERHRQSGSMLQTNKTKLEQEIEHLKYQTNNLNEMLSIKANELKTITLRQKQTAAQYIRKQQEWEEKHRQVVFQFQLQLRELKRTEQNKYLNATTNSLRKQKDLEDTLVRQQKLTLHIETMKEEYKKNEQMWKEKIETLRNNEHHLKQQCLSLSKKRQEEEEELIERMREMEIEIHSLNESLSESKQSQFKLLEREDRLRVQKDEIYKIYNQLKITSLKLKQQLQQLQDQLSESENNKQHLHKQLQINQNKYSKLVKQLKDKILEVQQQKIKIQTVTKEKERTWSQSSKSLKQQIEGLRSEIQGKEVEFKRADDQHRHLAQKDKSKMNELEIDIEKYQNELVRISSISSQKEVLIEQLHNEIREYRDSIKSMTLEKEGLLRSKEETETEQSDLKESINNYDNELYNKNKEIKEMKHRVEELEAEAKDSQLGRKRNKILFDDIWQILNRSIDSEGTPPLLIEHETNEYQSLMEIRKKLLVIENKTTKERQASSLTTDQYRRQLQEYASKAEQSSNQLSRLKAHVHSLKRTQQSQTEHINSLTIQNQELIYQINTLETNLMVLKTNSTVLDTKLRDEHEYYKTYEGEMKRQLEKYEKLVNDTRVELTEKYEKQKRELLGAIRAGEEKMEVLEQKNFSLELENQKIQEFVKREEENKKIFAKVFELERENFQLQQLQKEHEEKNLTIEEKLVWQKGLLEESNRNIQSKMQATILQLQTENNKLTLKIKQLLNLLKQKQFLLQQAEKSIQTTRQQSEQEIAKLKQQKERAADSEFKFKNELTKVKAELLLYKTNNEQNKDKLLSMQSLARVKSELQTELQEKNIKIIELEDREKKQNQEIFRLTQQFQTSRWQYQRKLTSKQSELMGIQQELYTINSKQNIRMLREIEYSEKNKLMELEKKNLLKEIGEYKEKCSRLLVENQRNIEVVGVRNYGEDKLVIFENEKKHEEVIKILEEEIKNLKNESSVMKKEVASD